MKEYMLLFRGGLDFNTASPELLQQSMMKWMTWMDGLKADGLYLAGERLTMQGAVVNGTEKQVTDGPYAEGKEIVAGFIAVKPPTCSKPLPLLKTALFTNMAAALKCRKFLKGNEWGCQPY